MKLFEVLVVLWILAGRNVQSEEVFAQGLMSCHPEYDKTAHQESHVGCLDQNKDSSSAHKCYKACMLQTFGIVFTHEEEGYPVKMVDKPKEDESNAMTYMLMHYVGYHPEILRSICTKVVENCSKELVPINDQKIPCDKWDSLYACVENAVKC